MALIAPQSVHLDSHIWSLNFGVKFKLIGSNQNARVAAFGGVDDP